MEILAMFLQKMPTLFPSIAGVFVAVSQFLYYRKSDGIKKLLVSTPLERFLSSIFILLIEIVCGISLTVLTWLYILSFEGEKISEFINNFGSDSKSDIQYIVVTVFLTVVTTYFVHMIRMYFSYFKNSPLQIKKSDYYIKSKDVPSIDKSLETKIYIIDLMKKDEILCCYELPDSNEFVRIILPYDSLVNTNIYTEKRTGFIGICLDLNREIRKLPKKRKILFFSACFIPLFFAFVIFLAFNQLHSFAEFSIYYISTIVVIFSPSIGYFIKDKMVSKLFLRLKRKFNKNE